MGELDPRQLSAALQSLPPAAAGNVLGAVGPGSATAACTAAVLNPVALGVILGGAGLVTAAVVTERLVHYRNEKREKEEDRNQSKVLANSIEKHVADYVTEKALESLTRDCKSSEEMMSIAPLPQVRMAFDALSAYTGTVSDTKKPNAKIQACDFLKAWLREKAEAYNLRPEEVKAFWRFCRDFILHKDKFREVCKPPTFIQTIGRVMLHLDNLLLTRMVQTRDCGMWMDLILFDSYSLLLNGLKTLLFLACDFTVPSKMYSTNSLDRLLCAAQNPCMFEKETDLRNIAEEMHKSKFWKTHSGRLIQLLLESVSVKLVRDEMEGRPPPSKDFASVCISLMAKNLPEESPNVPVDASVTVTITRRSEQEGVVLWEEEEEYPLATTEPLGYQTTGAWPGMIEVSLPKGDAKVNFNLSHREQSMFSGVTNKRFAKASVDAACPAQDSQRPLFECAGVEHTLVLEPSGPKKLSKMGREHLNCGFSQLFIRPEPLLLERLLEKDIDPEQHGLRDRGVGVRFVEAIRSVDSFARAMNLLLRARELYKTMGDCGMAYMKRENIARSFIDQIRASRRRLVDAMENLHVDMAMKDAHDAANQQADGSWRERFGSWMKKKPDPQLQRTMELGADSVDRMQKSDKCMTENVEKLSAVIEQLPEPEEVFNKFLRDLHDFKVILQGDDPADAPAPSPSCEKRAFTRLKAALCFSNEAKDGGGERLTVERISRQFKVYDKTGEGIVTKEELLALIKRLIPSWDDASADKIFIAVDKNGDGRVDFDEFLEFIFSRDREGGAARDGEADVDLK